MRKFILLIPLIVILFCGVALSADEIDESYMFPNPEMAAESSIVNGKSTADEIKPIGFSGEITSVVAGIVYSTSAKNSLYSYTVANIFLDIRKKGGLKAFANIETTYFSQSKITDVALRELFFDFNLENNIYLRTGKQALQWGRCYLWNPTDLINIEKKYFIRKIGYREGAYGLKIHVPFGAKYNIYSFLDTGNVSSPEDIGIALKYEFLLGNTEMAFSGWGKNNYNPVFGYDFSSRVKGVDIAGELSVSQKDNIKRMVEKQGTLDIKSSDDQWAPRASIDFSKSFRLGEFKDRISVTSEFYYNQTGYDSDIFVDQSSYQYTSPVVTINTLGTPVLTPSGTKKDFLLSNNLYEVHNYSRYYGALFTTVNRFIITDMVLNLNYIRNLCDSSGIVSTGVTYKNINDFSLGLLLSTNLGPDNREYTFSKEKLGIQLTLGIFF